ncbi:MAG: type IV pilin N-terminal domain-containing protein [Euryarchaeota archaeon]|nr:type IV pilin N-terminal domain-containing protein [Euryarchaeota archaeon]
MEERYTGDDGGVSPVIGTILMVAITVILAAIIAGTTLPLAGKVTTAPIASITVNATDGPGTRDAVGFTHHGGDGIKMSEVQVVISFENGSSWTSLGPVTTTPESLDVGETMTCSPALATPACSIDATPLVGASTSGAINFAAGDRLVVRMVHSPSRKAILDTVVTAS